MEIASNFFNFVLFFAACARHPQKSAVILVCPLELKFESLVNITLFIFLAQFLVTTKIKAKKLVATKNFGRDQFFALFLVVTKNWARKMKRVILNDVYEMNYTEHMVNDVWL